MAQTISPNRSELLKLKTKISMAKKGHSLLKKKRDGLVMDFFKLLENAKDLRAEMSETYKKATQSLQLTRIQSYDLEIKLLSKSAKGRNLINFQSKNIMGLSVPQIKSNFKKTPLIERNKTIYSTFGLDQTINLYEELVQQIIIVAEIETAMIRLLKEIEKTKRRVNGLEFSILPKLKKSQEYVKLSLEEMERDALIALKKIKGKIDKKKQ
jgi:V/A-type H+-transporting ATPase subunit D